MQGTPSGQGSNQNGKSSGLSWSSPSGTTGSQSSQTGSLLSATKPAQQTLPTAKPATQPATSSATATKMRMQKEAPSSGRRFGMIVALVVIGALVVWGLNGTRGGGSKTATTTGENGTPSNSTVLPNPSTPTTGIAAAGNIVVPSQSAGMSVTVSSATVSEPTWLVVYELYQGKPVRALGASMFFPDYNGKSGTITLLRETKAHTTYFVGQSLDAGDHKFTPHVNKEVLDGNGNMAGVTFTTN